MVIADRPAKSSGGTRSINISRFTCGAARNRLDQAVGNPDAAYVFVVVIGHVEVGAVCCHVSRIIELSGGTRAISRSGSAGARERGDGIGACSQR